jgi:hypothetical protein
MADRGGIAIAIAIGGVAIAIAVAGAPVGHAAGETGLRLKCRAFQAALDSEIDTRDPEAELGQWVLDHEDRGWKVQTVQLEVAQKQTGFPQGWAYVCLAPL